MARRPRSAPASEPTDAVEPIGTVRRSQLVSSFGIGAIIDLEKGSFMPMGLEDWERINSLPSLRIGEERLQSMLGVSHFRLGPVKEQIAGTTQVRARSAAPAVRFPEWHECPKCHIIGREGTPFELADDGARLRCTAHGGKVFTNPVRFVVACRRGHLSDFPWEWWAHRGCEGGICQRPLLRLGSRGESASLADLFVVCEACSTPERKTMQSLGTAFGADALTGWTCDGFRPWLHDRQADCREQVRALQRGASNVHFGVVGSALSIPPASEALTQIVEQSRMYLDGVPEAALPSVLAGVSQTYGVAVDQLLAAYRRLRSIEVGGPPLTDKIAREQEYDALSQDRDDPIVGGVVPQFQNEIFDPPPALSHWFDLVGATSRLREVRALAGFSRIEPHPVSPERVRQAIAEGKVSPLSKTERTWLPGAEIRGEGIFLRFRTETVDKWIDDNPSLAGRVAILETRSRQIAEERGYERDYTITPRLLLVHSFAHAFIRQISVECGYSASALRERLFVSDTGRTMNGVLIYTGSPDSEGSLGGLVRLSTPDLLQPIVLRTLANAGWCGSDPVCLETDPAQSGDRISGAACHCCLLLPETACERFNRELDRAVLVGDADQSFAGFFGNLMPEAEWQS
ncbi:DrmB family protein [Neorhizobium sp. DAR64860/K0K1]|uniref:DrmB family protein n=1 Tax=Neorhizobium sp. DAR64860/K0K1 TaxID=3421955 RepID=UPI003D2A4E2D